MARASEIPLWMLQLTKGRAEGKCTTHICVSVEDIFLKLNQVKIASRLQFLGRSTKAIHLNKWKSSARGFEDSVRTLNSAMFPLNNWAIFLIHVPDFIKLCK